MVKKPQVRLIGTDGNVFALLGKCTEALKKAGMQGQVKELREKVIGGDYNNALRAMMEYCDVC